MRFFDLNSFHSSDVNLKKDASKNKRKHVLDLRNKTGAAAKKVTDIVGKGGKKAFRYVTSQIEHRFKELHSSLIRFGALALILAFLFNFVSAVTTAQVVGSRLKTDAKETLTILRAAVSEGSGGDLSASANLLASGRINLEKINETISSLILIDQAMPRKGSFLYQGNEILSSANSLAEASEEILYSADRLLELIDKALSEDSKVSITDLLRKEKPNLEKIVLKLKTAQENLNNVDVESLPSEFKPFLNKLKTQLNTAVPLAEDFLNHYPEILEVLGDRYPRRYLILLQNRNEIRATGGFIGSLILVTLNDGVITELEVKDVYDFDGQIDENIPTPPGFGRITNNWGLRDSNYSPSFPTSAAQAAYFLEKANGPTVDGVIAVNQELVEEVLKIIGPIKLEELPVELNHQNFSTVLSFFVEIKLTGETTPKKPLQNLFPVFRERTLKAFPKNVGKFLDVLLAAKRKKQILAWSNDDELQSVFEWIGITGEIYENSEKEDYLQVVRTNVAGNKSDFFVSDDITHKSYIYPDGTIENELIIQRTHAWQNVWEIIWENLDEGVWDEELYEIAESAEGKEYAETVARRITLDNDLYEILGRGANIDYTRIYLPKNSELLSVGGIERISVTEFEELNKKVFAFEVTTLPGTTKEIRLRYRLPYQLNLSNFDDYFLYFEKQPGTTDISFNKMILPEDGYTVFASYPENSSGKTVSILKELENDAIFSAVVGRER